MTAQKAIETLEGLFSHYKENMPKHMNQIEKAIGALKDYIRYAEGRMASLQLDTIADHMEPQNPVIAMAIDHISDILDKQSLKTSGFLTELSAKATDYKGFVSNIEKDTINNTNFRKVLYTGKNSQLVLMSLPAGQDIGEEVHDDTDQFFRVEKGTGSVVINGNKQAISDGSAILIPQGAKHNVINEGQEPLALYTIYSPPHHRLDVVHATKEEAEADKEHFDGKTTE